MGNVPVPKQAQSIKKQEKPERLGKTAALLEVLLVSTKLGLTSFGGPIAHLGYFHNEYVRRRQWMDERSYADLVALCQLLPGPASSQVGIGIGIARAGLLGGIVAWIGFTLPSLIALIGFALLMQGLDIGAAGWIHGLKIVAVAVVAHALLGMGQKLLTDRARIAIAVMTMSVTLLWQTAYSQVLLIAAAGAVGLWLFHTRQAEHSPSGPMRVSRKLGLASLAAFGTLLVLLPVLSHWSPSLWADLFDRFYRAGAFVFGGGHVVLPLLEHEVMANGWVSQQDFLAGYGVTQAVPGPLFTFAGYLGAIAGGLPGAIVATVAIFLPAFLLVVGVLPFWSQLRSSPRMQGALAGINAAVVGILLAALYDPIWTSAIGGGGDVALAAILFSMLAYWKLPPWSVVLAGVAGGVGLGWM
ncbi:chromate transporter [Paenibacillus sp. MMS18-CY102]|uniref:chromate transporter n=1 Tax=Paenibacillus sp. MMS18-CY102 TaxID=2682849 RepID=UPI0013651D61|nr:chromate transporter [Paenibacillus sp. MMS18-CY102]MWC29375.1 chromate efflux transporter [Paenibacillus sp. MMS18-CY102]